jgi:hypothetical protein
MGMIYCIQLRVVLIFFCGGVVIGGINDQTLSNASVEGDLDTQFGFGLSFPTPGTYFSTGGSPPFQADALTPDDNNEPYLDVRCESPFLLLCGCADVEGLSYQWLQFMAALPDGQVPQTISTSYSDDEQTGENQTIFLLLIAFVVRFGIVASLFVFPCLYLKLALTVQAPSVALRRHF